MVGELALTSAPLQLLIVDDEPPARARLRSLIEELGHRVDGEAANGHEALQHVRHRRPDGVLLDIEMPGIDGLTLARQLERDFPGLGVVLVTAHGEHALDAFDADVQDYVLKPVRRERLARALERISAHLEPIGLDGQRSEPELAICLGRREQLIALSEIACLTAEEGYVMARSARLEGFVSASLQELEERFPEHVLRIHRSCLAVKTAIAGIESRSATEHRLLFHDGLEPVVISRRQLPVVKAFLKSRDAAQPLAPGSRQHGL